MNILFILDYFAPYIGWIETLFDDVTAFWIQQWHTIHVITSHHNHKLPKIEKRKGVIIYRIGANRFTIILQTLRFWFTHKQLLQSMDHIHTSTFAAAVPAWILSKFYKKPCTITIHEIYDILRYHLKKHTARLYIRFETILLRCSWAHIITVSNYTKSMIQNIHHLSDDSLSVIYNQVNTRFWDIWQVQLEDVKFLKKKHNLTEKKIGLFVGRLGYEKWLPYMIEAMSEIIKVYNNFVLIIIAPKTIDLYPKNTQQDIIDTKNNIINNNLSNNILWLDPVENNEILRLWMAISDIGIIPSMSEWFCYTAVQMQAMGLPLIVSKVGALPEVLDSHHTFIWYGKIQELITAICNILKDQPQHYSTIHQKPINYQAYYDIFDTYKK
jgi:glycosyltransferase involved in cell wall biosynthesis